MSIETTVGVWPSVVGRGRRNFQSKVLVMLSLLHLITLVEVLGNDLLNAWTRLSCQRVVFAISPIVHIVSSHETSYFGIFVIPSQFITLRVPVVLECDGVVGQAE